MLVSVTSHFQLANPLYTCPARTTFSRGRDREYGLLLLGEHTRRARPAGADGEHAGFQDLWFADEKFFRDPFVSLAHLAQHTQRLRLGTASPIRSHAILLCSPWPWPLSMRSAAGERCSAWAPASAGSKRWASIASGPCARCVRRSGHSQAVGRGHGVARR